MKLYRVYNGFMGEGLVRVIVVAESEQQAREMASEALKREGETRYGKRYYEPQRLEVELLTDDLTKPYASEATD